MCRSIFVRDDGGFGADILEISLSGFSWLFNLGYSLFFLVIIVSTRSSVCNLHHKFHARTITLTTAIKAVISERLITATEHKLNHLQDEIIITWVVIKNIYTF